LSVRRRASRDAGSRDDFPQRKRVEGHQKDLWPVGSQNVGIFSKYPTQNRSPSRTDRNGISGSCITRSLTWMFGPLANTNTASTRFGEPSAKKDGQKQQNTQFVQDPGKQSPKTFTTARAVAGDSTLVPRSFRGSFGGQGMDSPKHFFGKKGDPPQKYPEKWGEDVCSKESGDIRVSNQTSACP